MAKIFNITPEQQSLWIEWKRNPESHAYNVTLQCTIHGEVDVTRLSAAVDASICYFDTFRSCFIEQDGQVYQEIKETIGATLQHLSAQSAQEAEDIIRQKLQAPFTLTQAPLIRFTLIECPAHLYYFSFVAPHIFCDHITGATIFRFISMCYNLGIEKCLAEFAEDKDGTIEDYFHYTANAAKEKHVAAKDYWQQEISGSQPKMHFGYWASKTEVTAKGQRHYFMLTEHESRQIKNLSRTCGTTAFSVLLAGFNILLSRYFNRKDICVGYPVSLRPNAFKRMPFFFGNVLPMRVQLSGETKAAELIDSITRKRKESKPHQFYSLANIAQLVHASGVPYLESTPNILFAQTYFGLDGLELDGCTSRLLPAEYEEVNSDLSLVYDSTSTPYSFAIEYKTDIFDAATITAMIADLKAIYAAVAEDVTIPIDEICLSHEKEKNVLRKQEEAANNYTYQEAIYAAFERMASQVPQAIALKAKDSILTYEALNQKANRLARCLQKKGILPGDIVALVQERSVDNIIAILAVLKAGGAYLPINPAQPLARIETILENSRAKLILADAALMGSISHALNMADFRVSEEESHNLDLSPDANQPAYIIYTSGTTGTPKGVVVTHKNAAARMEWFHHYFGMSMGNNVLSCINNWFDPSVYEIFGALGCGATYVVMPDQDSKNAEKLLQILKNENISFVIFVPALLEAVLMLVKQQNMKLPHLKHLMCGGDTLSGILKQQFYQLLPDALLVNVYGPTEATIIATYEACTATGNTQHISIGKPISYTNMHILNDKLRLQPDGAEGEIFISGTGVAAGYLYDEKITNEKFLPNPFLDGAKMYKTGDRGIRLPDGEILFLGRTDNQIKLRGFRIEPGEIEQILLQKFDFTLAAVILRKDLGEQLVAFVTQEKEAKPLPNRQLRDSLSKCLPHYMVPAEFIYLEKMPVSSSGKIDRNALHLLPISITSEQAESETTLPLSEMEQRIAAIWAKLLHKAPNRLDMNTTFFNAGGDSLKAVALALEMEKYLGLNVPVELLFDKPTIRLQAEHFSAIVAADHPGSGPSANPPAKQEKEAIAIIGMACDMPDAPTLETFWQNLCNGHEAITIFSEDELEAEGISASRYRDAAYVPKKGWLTDADKFDAAFFNIPASAAKLLDPQQRLFLQLAYHAIEDAGYGQEKRRTMPVGIFAGCSFNTYLSYHLKHFPELFAEDDFQQMIIQGGNDFLCTRVAHSFNLRGPAQTIQTACSTSLVAIHHACNSLLTHQCDMALAGGVSITAPLKAGYMYKKDSIFSSTGQCKPFDAQANGTVPGNGGGCIMLKRLSDAQADGDRIYAVIAGIALNNDGRDKMSFAAPSLSGQVEVIKAAQNNAGIQPDAVSLIETHGTGTILGDRIELSALQQVFSLSQTPCALTSTKANIGHLDAAAGVAGVMRAALSLYHQQIAPLYRGEKQNPAINWQESVFYIPEKATKWDEKYRYAGVSSFGIGGTNAHAILKNADSTMAEKPLPEYDLFVLPYSAKSETSLVRMRDDLIKFIRANQAPLAEIAYTLQQCRAIYPLRRVLLADKTGALIEQAAITDSKIQALVADWLSGNDTDWQGYYEFSHVKPCYLPPYPFDRQRFWLSDGMQAKAVPAKTIRISAHTIEDAITESLKTLFEIENPDVNTPFESFGVDSMGYISLISELEKKLSISLSLEELYRFPTVQKLSAHIKDGMKEPAKEVTPAGTPSLTLLLKKGDTSQPPLFCIHPAGGWVAIFKEIVGHLRTERQIIGIQAIDEAALERATISHMATDYLTVIREKQPHGPYYLCGSSMGGAIAHEIACKLQAAGEKVALLAMLDSPSPNRPNAVPKTDEDILQAIYEFSPEMHHQLVNVITAGNAPKLKQFIRLWRLHNIAAGYSASHYKGNIIYYYAKERDRYIDNNLFEGWRSFMDGELEIHHIEGNHITMHFAEGAKEIAAHLEQVMK